MQTRRAFMSNLAMMGSTAAFGRLLAPAKLLAAAPASSGDYKALVCIALDGGCDTNSLIVPMDQGAYETYYSGREGLAIDKSTLLPFTTSQGSHFGFNPNLANISSLYASNRCAVLANVGSLKKPTDKYSVLASQSNIPTDLGNHQLQKYQWATSYTDTSSSADSHSGWGGRIADALSGYSSGSFPIVAMAAGGVEAAFGNGSSSVPAFVSPGSIPGIVGASSLQMLTNMKSKSVLLSAATDGLNAALQQSQVLSNALNQETPLQTPFPATDLGQQLAEVAKLIACRGALGLKRQIFLCEQQGYDNHEFQAQNQPALLVQLDQAVAAFQAALAELGLADSVVCFTTSDFGRSLQENTLGGTDHAWGSHHMIFGQALKRSDMFGTFPDLTLGGKDDLGTGGCWIPTTPIDQYGATLASWMGVPDSALNSIFPNLANFSTNKLSFL